MFTLPPGYRPKLEQWFITYGSGMTQAYVEVGADGDIVRQGGTNETGTTTTQTRSVSATSRSGRISSPGALAGTVRETLDRALA